MIPRPVRDLTTYQQLVVVGLVICLGVTGLLFTQAMGAYMASHHTDFMDATAVDYDVHEADERITVTIEVENPSRDDFVVTEHLVRSEVDGEAITYSGRQFPDEETVVPPGDSVEITASLQTIDDRATGVDPGELSFEGSVAVEAHGERYFLDVETAEEAHR